MEDQADNITSQPAASPQTASGAHLVRRCLEILIALVILWDALLPGNSDRWALWGGILGVYLAIRHLTRSTVSERADNQDAQPTEDGP
jgi:hypothetical protein